MGAPATSEHPRFRRRLESSNVPGSRVPLERAQVPPVESGTDYAYLDSEALAPDVTTDMVDDVGTDRDMDAGIDMMQEGLLLECSLYITPLTYCPRGLCPLELVKTPCPPALLKRRVSGVN